MFLLAMMLFLGIRTTAAAAPVISTVAATVRRPEYADACVHGQLSTRWLYDVCSGNASVPVETAIIETDPCPPACNEIQRLWTVVDDGRPHTMALSVSRVVLRYR
jgi:hypothetical protein